MRTLLICHCQMDSYKHNFCTLKIWNFFLLSVFIFLGRQNKQYFIIISIFCFYLFLYLPCHPNPDWNLYEIYVIISTMLIMICTTIIIIYFFHFYFQGFVIMFLGTQWCVFWTPTQLLLWGWKQLLWSHQTIEHTIFKL